MAELVAKAPRSDAGRGEVRPAFDDANYGSFTHRVRPQLIEEWCGVLFDTRDRVQEHAGRPALPVLPARPAILRAEPLVEAVFHVCDTRGAHQLGQRQELAQSQ